MAEEFKACLEPGCKKNAHYKAGGARGCCGTHYMRLIRKGGPLEGRAAYGGRIKFIHDVAMNYAGEDCLKWPFPASTKGYGQIWLGGKHVLAHRYVCEAIHGAPPTPDHEAAHSCGKGHEGCVTPSHLSWKTRAANFADKIDHNTHSRGERHAASKLTEDSVRQIREMQGLVTQTELAKMYGVDRKNIAQIHARKAWGWLT